MAMIDIKDVSKWYGTFQVLTDCTTKIEKGEVVVVCGPSGSGKSTLIKTVNALEPFQKGAIVVDGISISDKKTNLPKLRSRVGMVFQHFELFPHLSITDNLTIAQRKVLVRAAPEHLHDRARLSTLRGRQRCELRHILRMLGDLEALQRAAATTPTRRRAA